MRSLFVVFVLALPCLAQQDEYVKVSHPRAVAHGIYEQLVSRRVVLDANNLRIVAGKLETVTSNKDGKKAWVAIDPKDPFELVLLLQPYAYYENNNELVFVRKDVYKALAPVLPQMHFGQIEHFLKEGITIPKKNLLADPDNFDTYIWDVTDKTWRYPESLLVVSEDDPKVKYHGLNGRVPDRSTIMLLPPLAAEHHKKVAAFRAAQKKE